MIHIQSGARPSRGRNIGLALGGGGPVGLVYEVGVLRALEESLSLDLTELHSYIGVSAGAPNVAYLANGVTPKRMYEVLIEDPNSEIAAELERALSISYRKLVNVVLQLPRAWWNLCWQVVTQPSAMTLAGALTTMADKLHLELFDGATGERLAERLLRTEGRSNDFRELGRRLFIVATHVDTGEAVKFGAPGYQHVPISRAIRASTCLPGLYKPVEIDGEHYFDGGTRKTFHASTLYDAGADFIICVNPLVPYDARAAREAGGRRHSILEAGTRAVVMQAAFQMVHSRLTLGLEQYVHQYPNRELILIEPDRGDEEMFFVNLWGVRDRQRLYRYGYESTLRSLASRREELEPMLARHGIELRLPGVRARQRRPARKQSASGARGGRAGARRVSQDAGRQLH